MAGDNTATSASLLYITCRSVVPSHRALVAVLSPAIEVCEELCGCFKCTDWNVFVDSYNSVEDLNDCVTEYVKFCEDLVCEKKEISYPNKPWVTKNLKNLLNQ